MAHQVICLYCKQKFDRDKVPAILVQGRRYAHAACVKDESNPELQKEKDKNALLEYARTLLNLPYADVKIKKQIESYVQQYNFSYSGMLKALQYFYEIKGNDVKEAHGGIGIIPYIYQESYNYYYNIWKAQQQNANKDMNQFIPKIIEINIPSPQRSKKKRNIFSFLDREAEDGEEQIH